MKEYLKAIANDSEFRKHIGDTIRLTTLMEIIERYTDTKGVIPELLEAGYVEELCPYYYSVTYLPEELDFALEVFYLSALVDYKLPTNVFMLKKDFKDILWYGCSRLGINRDRKSMWRLFKSSKYVNTGLNHLRISLKSPSELDLTLMTDYEERDLYSEFREIVV